MFSLEDLKNIYDNISLEELRMSYDTREYNNNKIEEKQFNLFLREFNRKLDKETNFFSRNLLNDIIKNIFKENYKEEFLEYFYILSEVSKPKTTDFNVLGSLEWQMKQTLSTSYNELSKEEKICVIFQIIFGKFNFKVQKQFLKLLKRFNFNSSMDLLLLMSSIIDYYNNNSSLDSFYKSLKMFTSVKSIKSINTTSLIVNTKFGEIPFSCASKELNINNPSLLTLGKCHFAVSKFLKEFPKFYGAYYYIPNYFGSFIEHSVMIDYEKNYVYDLSHNIALPLEYFYLYYGSPSFIISSKDFSDLSDFVEHEYGFVLYMPYIEEVKRRLKK